MMKLNNKGMSVVELLASFILVALILTTLYSTMNNMGDRRVEESAKESIYTYKNLSAMSHFGNSSYSSGYYCVSNKEENSPDEDENCVPVGGAYLTRVVFTFRDTTRKILIVAKGSTKDIIAYGAENDLHIYPLPKYDGDALRVGNVKSSVKYPVVNFEMRFEHPLFSQKYGVFIRGIINIDLTNN